MSLVHLIYKYPQVRTTEYIQSNACDKPKYIEQYQYQSVFKIQVDICLISIECV